MNPALRRLWAMICKEMWAVLRDPRARITLVVPPILQLVLFGFASTLEVKNIDIGVYNRDQGAWSREFIQQLAGSPNVRRIVVLNSPEAVRTAINRREVIAAVAFDETFSADVAAGRGARAQAIFDGRRSNAAQIVGGYLNAIAASVGSGTQAAVAPPATVVTNWFNPNLDYLWFTMPSLVVTIAALSALSVTAQSIARERELGTFDQLMVSPLRTHEILIGKIVPPFLVGMFNSTLYIILIPLAFRVPLTGSISILYVALAFFLLSVIGVGLLVSTVSQSQQQAFLGMFLAVVPLILLSGYASPVDNMPGWLQIVAQADPLKHFLVVAEGVFLKAMPVGVVLANTWPLMLIAAVTTGAAALLFRARME